MNVHLPSPPAMPHTGRAPKPALEARGKGVLPSPIEGRRGGPTAPGPGPLPTPRGKRVPAAPHPQLQHGGVDGGRPVPLEAGHHGAQEPVTERRLRRWVVAGALPGTESGRKRRGSGGTRGTHRHRPPSPPLPWASSAPVPVRRPPPPAPAGTEVHGHRPAARTGRSCPGSQRGTAARGGAPPVPDGRHRRRR